MAALDDAHEIAALLFSAVDLTRSRFDEMCARFAVTPVQARAVLALEKPLAMRELAKQLRCDPSNITGIVDRLEQRGLVIRQADAGDRRVKLLVATPAGRRVRRELEAALGQTSPFMAALTRDERRTFKALLAKIVGATSSG